MNFHLKQLTVAAALLLAFSGVQAQTASVANSAPSAAKKELIAKVLSYQQPGIESLARALVEQPASRLMQGAGAALQQVPQDKREAMAKAIEADVRKFVDEASALTRDKAIQLAPTTIGPMLDEKFNEDELKQLIAWFESPVNKKYQQMGGEMQNALGQKLVAEMRGTIETKLKTLEQGVAKRLGLNPQPAPTPPTSSKPVAPSASAAKK